jgi:rare lipoprotein A (peptidoglycan hydrolase)
MPDTGEEMTFRRTLGLSLALLVISAGAMAKPVPGAQQDKLHNSKAKVVKAKGGRGKLARSRAGSGRVAEAHRAHIVHPHTVHPHIVHPHIVHPRSVHARIVHPRDSETRAERHRVAHSRFAHPVRGRAAHQAHEAAPRSVWLRHALVRRETEPHRDLRSIVHYAVQTEPIGRREIGRASWYGGRHVGRRTASGAILDRTHPTIAHRTLPLDTLVRVTNLKNGRSVIAVVNDRGPVSRRLLVDLSPEAADQLDMKRDGIVPVSVTPIAATPTAMEAAALR